MKNEKRKLNTNRQILQDDFNIKTQCKLDTKGYSNYKKKKKKVE